MCRYIFLKATQKWAAMVAASIEQVAAKHPLYLEKKT